MNEARTLSQKNLDAISEALAGIFAANEMNRQFLDASHADIKRANRLEIENAGFSAECRRLAIEVDRLRKQCDRHETQAEVQQAREEKFVQATGKLRENLHAAKLGLAEASSLLSASEARQAELQAEVLAKSNLIDRLNRESEVLRGRLATMALEMDSLSRKLAETRRQHEELQTVHARTLGDHSETEVKLAAAESEASRLQKLTDVLEARLTDAEDALNEAAVEADERESRYQSEVRILRQENQTLNSRLSAKTAEQLDAFGENLILKSRLDDLESDRQPADRQAPSVPLQIANDALPATLLLENASPEPEADAAEDDAAEDDAAARDEDARETESRPAVAAVRPSKANGTARVARPAAGRDAQAV
jgi:chromosome segregation ATPase